MIYPCSTEGIGMAFVEKAGEVWRCKACGNVVRVVKAGGGPMTKVE